MRGIETSYRVLGLNPGASEAEIGAAHKDLLDKLYPDLLSQRSSVRKTARERMKEVNEAYDELTIRMSETAFAAPPSSVVTSHSQESEPSLHESDTPQGNDVKAQAPPGECIAGGYVPPSLAVLVLLVYLSTFGISGVGSTLLAIIFGALGWFAGHALVKGANILNAPRLQKSAVAWMTVTLLFVVLISLNVVSSRSARSIMTESRRQAAEAPQRTSPAMNEQNEREGSIREFGSPSGAKANPSEGISWLSKGKELIIAGQYAEAIDSLTRSIELNPTAAAYNSRGVAFAYSHQYQKAVGDYDMAIELNPGGDGAYYLNRGIVRVAQGKYQQAIADYKKAASLGNEEARNFFDSQNLLW